MSSHLLASLEPAWLPRCQGCLGQPSRGYLGPVDFMRQLVTTEILATSLFSLLPFLPSPFSPQNQAHVAFLYILIILFYVPWRLVCMYVCQISWN